MEGITIEIIRKSELLPPLNEENFFHSAELFRITEQVPGSSPFMAVAMKDGRPIAHLLAVVRRRIIWLPFVLLKQGRIYGEGVYHDTDKDAPAQEDHGTVPQEELFGLMLKALTRRLVHSLCFSWRFPTLVVKCSVIGSFAVTDIFHYIGRRYTIRCTANLRRSGLMSN